MGYEKPFQKKNNSGSLFANNKKQNHSQPDYRGDILINNEEYWISGWKQQGKNGTSYISLAVSKKDAFNIPAKESLVPATPPTPVVPTTQEGEADLPF